MVVTQVRLGADDQPRGAATLARRAWEAGCGTVELVDGLSGEQPSLRSSPEATRDGGAGG